jgi:endonuclease III
MDVRIRERLLAEGHRFFEAKPAFVEFTGEEPADQLVNDLDGHSHAFVIACVMDRQVKAEIAWRVPYRLGQRLGTFRFERLKELTEAEIRDRMNQPEPLHRFPDMMARNVFSTIRHIEDSYDGVASKIWADKPSSAEVVFRFLRFRGVGPKIATMAANILARDFKMPFSDYYSIDISVDRHIRRVLKRLCVVPADGTDDEVIFRARALSPEFPGLLDLPCWEIGRQWCKPTNPLCHKCVMGEVCPTAQ